MAGRATRPARWLRVAARTDAPWVLTCEHASRRLPGGLRPTRDEQRVLASHWGWDIGAWDLTRRLARATGAAALGGGWSRLWIDLNRKVDDPTLIRTDVEGVALSWNRALGARRIEQRITDVHMPYHQAIDRQIVRLLVRGVRPLILALHTFTPALDGQARRFDAGVLFDDHGPAARRLARTLRTAGLTVRYNAPYSGMAGLMYAADRHGRHHALTCLELEVNQGRLAEPRFSARLAQVLERGLRELGHRS